MKEENKSSGKGIWILIAFVFGGGALIVIPVFLLLFGAIFLIAEDDEKKMGSFGSYCSVNGEVNKQAFSSALGGVFAGKEQAFFDAAEEWGIDPVLMAAVAMHETANGTSNAVVNYNNPGGLMDPATGSTKLFRFNTLEDGLNSMGKTLHNRIIKDGLNTIEKLGSVYAPIGAANDPTGLNANWVPRVTGFVNQLGGLIMNCEMLSFGDLVIPTLGQFHVTSHYGMRNHPDGTGARLHSGIDLNCNTGDPIVASLPGTVIYTEQRPGGWSTGWGNYVLINHGDMNTVSAHLNSVIAKIGDTVNAGEVIGACGNTGNSFGAHLHFEIRIGGNPINPYPYLMGEN